VAAGEVAHQGAGFAGDQLAGGEVPRLEGQFEVTVNAACGDVAEIQRGRAGAAEVGALGEQLAENVHIGCGVLLRLKREAGGQNGAVQVAGGAAAQAVAVQLCALAAGGGEQLITHRIVNHGHFSTAFNAYGDGNGEMGKALNKVGGAIQRIDNPLHILIFACVLTALFGNDGVLRVRFADSFDNHRFCGFIDVGHEIIAAFLAGLYGVRRLVVLGNNITRLARCAHGDGQHRMLHRLLSLDVKERGKTAHIIAANSASVLALCYYRPIIFLR